MEKLIAGAKRLGIELSPEQIGQFELYFRELVAWNNRINLTGITDRDQVQTRHFLDSLTVVLAFGERPPQSARVLDVGSGAGLPGIPLKVLYPDIRLTLLESTMKKARFLAHLAGVMGTPDIEVLCHRAEELGHDAEHRERYAVVLSRAVAPLPTLVELTMPFCRIGGIVVAQKKGRVAPEVEQASFGVEALGGRIRELLPISVQELGDDQRALVIIEKFAPTPARYPRRAGIPQKRPLRAAA